jgi:hypothetical protein
MTVGPPKRYLMALGACRRWRDVPCSRASRSLQILHPDSGCREQWDGSQLSNDAPYSQLTTIRICPVEFPATCDESRL